MNKPVIEKDIPIPEITLAEDWLKQMEVGDSILFATESLAGVQKFYRAAKILKVAVTARREGQGYRIWRWK